MATRQQTLAMIMMISLAFTLSTMSALRFGNLPLGFAEIILILCLVVHLPLGHGVHGGNSPNRFVPVLVLLLLAMLPGYFVTLIQDGVVPYVLYNLIATVWVVVLFAYLHFGFDHGRGEIDQLARFFLFFSSLYFVIVLVLAWFDPPTVYGTDSLGLVTGDALNEDGSLTFRLIGLSTNPNQLALHALIASFFALVLWRRNGTLVSFVCLALAAAVGVLSKSDAFLFAEVALVGIWVVAGIVFGRSVVLGLVVLVPVVIAAVILFRPVLHIVQDIASTGGQNDIRFALWENGILAGLERPFIGLGPGSWSGLDGPRQLEEAHNSAVDYFSNAGLIGLSVMLIGAGALLLRALVTRQAAMLAGATAIILFPPPCSTTCCASRSCGWGSTTWRRTSGRPRVEPRRAARVDAAVGASTWANAGAACPLEPARGAADRRRRPLYPDLAHRRPGLPHSPAAGRPAARRAAGRRLGLAPGRA